MAEEKKNIPKLRFREFTGDDANAWELRKFENFVKKSGAKNKNGGNFPAYSVSNTLGLVPQTEQFEESRLSSLEKKDYRIVRTDGFAYNPARINVGSIAFNNTKKTVIVGSLYVILKMSEVLDNEFVLQFIKSDEFLKDVKRKTEGSVREYLFFANFKNINFPYISNLKEQQKIGSFFKHLDELITLHQRMLDEYKTLKKTMLSKMFPKNSEKYPELRFSGFTDAWELRKLGKLIKNYPFKEYVAKPSENGKYQVIQQGDKPVIGYADGNAFQDFKEVTLFGDHTVSLYKPTAPFFVATDGIKIISAEKCDGDYFFSILERYKPESQGYKRHFRILKDKDVLITYDSAEQQKIGNFFKHLDELITLHQRELELLKTLKKTMLQQMFV